MPPDFCHPHRFGLTDPRPELVYESAWRPAILSEALSADLIVVIPHRPDSDPSIHGLYWESDVVQALGLTDRTIVLLPDGRSATDQSLNHYFDMKRLFRDAVDHRETEFLTKAIRALDTASPDFLSRETKPKLPSDVARDPESIRRWCVEALHSRLDFLDYVKPLHGEAAVSEILEGVCAIAGFPGGIWMTVADKSPASLAKAICHSLVLQQQPASESLPKLAAELRYSNAVLSHRSDPAVLQRRSETRPEQGLGKCVLHSLWTAARRLPCYIKQDWELLDYVLFSGMTRRWNDAQARWIEETYERLHLVATVHASEVDSARDPSAAPAFTELEWKVLRWVLRARIER